ncbi:hypothetical protein [Methanovulcanius yangii]|uniref:hypothetical protein n=1 Tax=Methanovulcanius yangii TaxID=1789227 RepID=UPI0029CA801E|nr:hypothetical protein [Methanovulcanius yangii]
MTSRNMSIIAILMILMLLTMPAAAAAGGVMGMTIQAGKSTQAPGDGAGQQPTQAPGLANQSQAGTLLQTQTQDQLKACEPGTACNGSELRRMVAEQEQLINAAADQQIRESNTVRLAVHTFTIAAPLLGNESGRMLGLAGQVNTSAQVTLQAEERIQTRSAIMRALFGGDAGAAAILQQEITANQERITEMNQLIDECDCDPETREVLMEQVALLEQEQQRLRDLAQGEVADTGLLGWLFR